jgi:hypothetical protein
VAGYIEYATGVHCTADEVEKALTRFWFHVIIKGWTFTVWPFLFWAARARFWRALFQYNIGDSICQEKKCTKFQQVGIPKFGTLHNG